MLDNHIQYANTINLPYLTLFFLLCASAKITVIVVYAISINDLIHLSINFDPL